ncbi:MAG: PrsW family intramembrane metalloprotease, partial [Ktedonobacteraceae bacterium]|nr:PrsW family intramembrane metalloprotease [Ktedonobacteraceae bacterium]
EHGWRVVNRTERSVVRVNGNVVPAGGSMPLRSQDYVLMGCTTLQFLAPENANGQESPLDELRGYRTLLAQPEGYEDGVGNGANGKMDARHALYAGREAEPEEVAFEQQPPPTPEDLSEVEETARDWKSQHDSLIGVTMQFALPRRLGSRTRGFIVGACLAILLFSALVTVALTNLVGISFSKSGVPNMLVALIIPLIPALGISLLVSFIDRYEREPWFLRLAAFLWGAIIAIPTALLIEQNVERMLLSSLGQNDLVSSIFRGLNAGVTEETVKGLGLLLLFVVLRDEFDNVTDGIVYGALIGAGFAMVENFVYFLNFSRDYLLFLIIGRVVLGWLCHSTFTVCFGAALGYVRHTRVRWRQILIPLLGYLCAVGLHTAFDFINVYANALLLNYPDNANVALLSLIAIIGNYIPPFLAQIALLYILIKALAHEGAVIREFLASEVSSGIVLAEEYALLQSSFRRARMERRVLWQRGFRQWLRVRALYQTQIGLAFRKWHVSMGDRPKLGYMQPEDAYRRRIKHLRDEIVQGG